MRQPFQETLVAGDAWNWTVRLEDSELQTSAGVSLAYYFRGAGKTLDLTSSVNADGTYTFAATSVQTLALNGSGEPIELTWQLCFYDASNNRTELARGTVTILPDIKSAATTIDGRSWAKTALDAVCAVIEGRASRVEKEYQIAGRHVGLLSPNELLELRGNLQALYDRELIASGQARGTNSQIRAAFGPRQVGAGEWK